MRKSAADRFRHLFNRSLVFVRNQNQQHHHPSPLRSLSSMASDSPFPVTAQNINPQVLFFLLPFDSCFQWFLVMPFLFLGLFEFKVLNFINFFMWVFYHDEFDAYVIT